MAKKILFIFIGLLTLQPVTSLTASGHLNGTYTIDPSRSASATNFISISVACKALTTDTLDGDVTFKIADGTYYDQVNIDGMSSGYVITFTSASASASLVKLLSPKKSTAVVYLRNDTIAIKFDYLSFDSQVDLSNIGGTDFSNCVMSKTQIDGEWYNFSNCLFTEDLMLPRSDIYHLDVSGCTFRNANLSIDWTGGNGSYVNIDKNTVFNGYIAVGDDAFGFGDNVAITDNIIYNGWMILESPGIMAFNKIYGGGVETGGDYLSGALVFNNYATGHSGLSGAIVVNNTLLGEVYLAPTYINEPFDVIMKNNIIGGYLEIVTDDIYDTLISKVTQGWHNNCYSKANIAFEPKYGLSNQYKDINSWLTSSSDRNSIEAEPAFNSDGVTPSNYLLDGKATLDTLLQDDLFHIKRGAKRDIGAVEFKPIYNDMAAARIENPIDSMCTDTSGMVGIRVVNAGYKNQSGYKLKIIVRGKTTDSASIYCPAVLKAGYDTLIVHKFSSLSAIYGGTYHITAYTILPYDSNTSNDTVSSTIHLSPINISHFYLPKIACQGQMLQVHDSSIYWNKLAKSYRYYVFDSSHLSVSSSTLPSPFFTFSKPGRYYIEQWIIDSPCSAQSVDTVLVKPLPTADFRFGNTCLSDTTAFINNTMTAISWKWDFGDGGASLLQSPGHLYSSLGKYTVRLRVISVYGCSDSTTKTVEIDTACVWPGDANADKIVNLKDFLAIGIAFGSTGPTRTSPNLLWRPQSCENWADSLITGINFKHSDCDGNGTVGFPDTTAVLLNFSKAHPKTLNRVQGNPTDPQMRVRFAKHDYYEGDTMVADILCGTPSKPAYLYGYNLSLDFNAALIDSTFSEVKFTSLLTNNPLTHQKTELHNGNIALVESRMAFYDTIISGKVATIQLIAASGIPHDPDTLRMSIYDNCQVDKQYNFKPFYLVNDSTLIHKRITALPSAGRASDFRVYPDPANEMVEIRSAGAQMEEFSLYTLEGGQIINKKAEAPFYTLDVGLLPEGMYVIRILTQTGSILKKLMVQH